jgi:hypothetical protein
MDVYSTAWPGGTDPAGTPQAAWHFLTCAPTIEIQFSKLEWPGFLLAVSTTLALMHVYL